MSSQFGQVSYIQSLSAPSQTYLLFYRDAQVSCSQLSAAQATAIRKLNLECYKKLQVLSALYNTCLSSFAWPSFILTDLTHSLFIYLVVKLLGRLEAPVAVFSCTWALGWFVIDFYVFPHMGRTQEYSIEFLRLLSKVKRSEEEKAVLKSLRPLHVRVSCLFSMSPTTVLRIIDIVCTLTINALLII